MLLGTFYRENYIIYFWIPLAQVKVKVNWQKNNLHHTKIICCFYIQAPTKSDILKYVNRKCQWVKISNIVISHFQDLYYAKKIKQEQNKTKIIKNYFKLVTKVQNHIKISVVKTSFHFSKEWSRIFQLFVSNCRFFVCL